MTKRPPTGSTASRLRHTHRDAMAAADKHETPYSDPVPISGQASAVTRIGLARALRHKARQGHSLSNVEVAGRGRKSP